MNQGSRRSFGIIVAAFCLMAVALGVVLFHNSSRKPEPQTDSSAEQAAPAAPETESTAPHTSTSRSSQKRASLPEISITPTASSQSTSTANERVPTPFTQYSPPLPPSATTAQAQNVPTTSSRWADAFRSTADPVQFAATAKQFAALPPEQIGPGEISAVREVLDRVASGEPKGVDIGPLFQALQKSSDPGVIQDLVQRLPQWPYYSAIALAELPNGQGIPALVQQLQALDPSAAETRNFIFQMLAQQAIQYPDAANALLDQVRATQLSARTWQRIANGLAGDQYQFTSDMPSTLLPDTSLKSYHMERGNQNFYSYPLAPDAQIQQRLAFMDQLIPLTSDPNALKFLQTARTTLANIPAK